MKKAQAKNSESVSESTTRSIEAVPVPQQEDEPTPRSALLENERTASTVPDDETCYISDVDDDDEDGEHAQTGQSNELVNQPPKVHERASSLSSYAAASLAVNRTASASADQNSIPSSSDGESMKHVAVKTKPHQGGQSTGSHDAPHIMSLVAHHQREMEYRNPLSPQLTHQPQLFTRKLMELHLLQPPPPPPPLPPQGLKSPKTPKKNKGPPSVHDVLLADHPSPPPITPKTPGGTRRKAFVEDSIGPVSSTPRESPKTPMMPRSPRDTFVEPSPSPARTPTSRSASQQFVSSTRSKVFADTKSNDSHDTNSVSRNEIPAPPTLLTENREKQQRKNRGVFQKSFLEATTSRPKRSSSRRDIKLSALSNSIAPPGQEAKNATLSSPSNCVGATENEVYRSRISSPLSVITKQSFGSAEAARRDRWKNKLLKEAGQRHPAERVSFPTSSSPVSSSGGDATAATKQKKKKNSLGASWQEIMQFPSRTLTRKDILCYQNSVTVSRSKALMACYLCTKNFRVKDVIRTLPCNHSFHTCCIDQFLFQQAECPMCKHPAVVLEI